MSNSSKKDVNEIFTVEQVNDSSEIPGIAELLASKVSKKESAQVSVAKDAVKFNRPVQNTSIKSLKEFGTKLEIHFLLKDDVYEYIQHSDLSHSKFFGLDELYQGMKVSVLFVQDIGNFAEFKQDNKNYLFDAFGITEQPFIQFVLNQGSKILTAYISEKSMQSKKDDVIAYAENNNANLSASGIDMNAA